MIHGTRGPPDLDAAWVAAQVLAPEEIAVSRFGGDEFSAETTVDLEARAKMEEAPEPDEGEVPEKDAPERP